ncbi:MAG: energy-coupling factor transporter transmembrane protein EcfT [Erysipelotrichaceae bacterium]|jgi:energy-coupling factor transport system permease protein|nr:energy-coupling factor transporter transmembrane protein EcfT [Erysipelotrichaceae bacterium]MBQ1379639.1 energy-coupling factor transporter transmembrane protein EcfT [Erysipelotrichaceae bacterium]MBQ1625513.1 energy-coupling factor transporter transmembrane protein EcfT [Erysipelotrichaceae bacterium]MBQ2078553.1 energy-coupling factor transporter transmembrane protein EcfT [Erysipelotrichaceae bacterium]MBQ2138045.1 energy-coupling factor transporter transmembrane protein EcfT [Erysipelo
MNNLVFGKYIPIDSLMHRLDPRAKLIGLFLMIAAVFIPKSWWVFLVIALLLAVALLLAKIGIKMIVQSFKPMIMMMIFLLVINSLTIKTGDVMFTIGTFAVYKDAIFNTLFVITRLLLMISITTLLTATTNPLDLTLGIEWLLKPLEVIHFPAHEVAMMVSIALRFIPTIIEETMRIMNAQKSRGVDFENGRLAEKISAILSLIVPLFSVAFERAYELADAMEARGYVPGEKRTRYHVLHFRFMDYLFIFICMAILAFSILSRIYL